MRAGTLRHRVTLQRVSHVKSATGMGTETWADLGSRWADIQPARGAEFEAGPSARAETSHQIRLRHDSLTGGLLPRDRITYNGRVFDIQQNLNRNERNKERLVMAEEVL